MLRHQRGNTRLHLFMRPFESSVPLIQRTASSTPFPLAPQRAPTPWTMCECWLRILALKPTVAAPPRHIFKLATLAWMRLLFVVSEHFRACLFLCLASHCFPGYFVIISMSIIIINLCRCSCCGHVCMCAGVGTCMSQPVCGCGSMYVTACV